MIRGDIDLELIDKGKIPNRWLPSVWTSLPGQYPILNSFANCCVWDGLYTKNTDTPRLIKASIPAVIKQEEEVAVPCSY